MPSPFPSGSRKLPGAGLGDQVPGPGLLEPGLAVGLGENGEAGEELEPVTEEPSTKCRGRGPLSDKRLFCLDVTGGATLT